MKLAPLLALALLQLSPRTPPPVATPQHLAYTRAITLGPGNAQTCAILDPAIFAHAAPSLRDLRLFPADSANATPPPHEIPYAITLSETSAEDIQPARVINLSASLEANHPISFDLEMPDRPYTNVILDLAGHDFLATATVTGRYDLGTLAKVSTSAPSPLRPRKPAPRPQLHPALAGVHLPLPAHLPQPDQCPRCSGAALHPAIVTGAQIPPSRGSQILYTAIPATSALTTSGRETRATFTVPERIPIERVAFTLDPSYTGNFSRNLTITASADTKSTGTGDTSSSETLTGTILRVHKTESGRDIRIEQLSVPAILGANPAAPGKGRSSHR